MQTKQLMGNWASRSLVERALEYNRLRLLGSLAILVLLIGALYFVPFQKIRWVVFLLLFDLAISGAHRFALYRNRALRYGMWASLIVAAFINTVGLHISGGTISSAIGIYLLLIMAAALVFLRKRAAYNMAGISAIFYLLLVFGEQMLIFPIEQNIILKQFYATQTDLVSIHVFFTLIMMVLMAVLAGEAAEASGVWGLQLETAIEQRTRELAAFLDANENAMALSDIDEALQVVCARIQTLFQTEQARIYLMDDAQQVLYSVPGVRHNNGSVQGRGAELMEEVMKQVARTSIPVAIPPIKTSQASQAKQSADLVWLCVPLIDTARTVGVMSVSRKRSFTHNDLRVLNGLAGHAAITIKNAQLYSGLQHELVERKYTNSALRNSEERFRILYEANPSMYFTVSADGIILSVNQFGADELGHTIDDLVGQPIPSIFHPEDQMAVQQSLAQCLQYPTELVNWEFREIRKDSAIMWVEGRARAVHDVDGELVVLIVCNNINERKHAEELLRHLASRDMLTNLSNRAHFYTYMEGALSQAALHEQKMALLFLDLDRLKMINDTWGHIAGDTLLKMVAGRLRANTPTQSIIARMGGDEFVILLEPLLSVREAMVVARQVRDALSQPFIIHRREVFITCSIGISIYPNHGQETLVLLKNADAAMYQAKKLGKNDYQLYTEMMQTEAAERLEIENYLRQAWRRKELTLHYQPQIHSVTGEITGVEALLRWHHPKLGWFPAERFVFIAEEMSLIIPISEWVLRTACTQGRAWLDAGLPPVTVAVNLSRHQFMMADLPVIVEKALRETGFPAHLLELELTEQTMITSVAESIEKLNALKALGGCLALDDFGTGYSSLSYLKRFPIDRLKIDRSFIRDITTNTTDAAIASTIITMAKNLKLDVIAEGVETAEQLALLQQHKCYHIQGHYYARAVPAGDIEKMLQDKPFLPTGKNCKMHDTSVARPAQ